MDLDERKAAILRAIVEEHITTAQPVGSQTIARSRGSQRVERDRAQRDDRPRARGLPRAAAHVRRPDPHRPRLPLLRRPLHAPARARAGAAPGRLRLLHAVHVGAPGARRPAARDQPAARPGEHAHRGRRRPAPRRRRDGAQRAAGQPPAVAGARAGDPVERQRREVRAAPRRRHRRRHDRHRRPRCSTRSSSGSRWVALPELRPVAGTARPTPSPAKRATRSPPAASTRSSSRSTSAGRAGSRPSRRRSRRSTSAARLLELLEHQVEVVSLVRDLLDQGPTVSIGSENPLDELRDCSIVVAPYRVDGEVAGTVGVLGPTRMDYRQALAAVEAISQQLGGVSRELTEAPSHDRLLRGPRDHPHRDRRRDQARVPRAGAAVPPRQQPRRPRRRGAVQGSEHRVRDAARSRASSPLRRLRRRRRPCRRPRPRRPPAIRSGSATSSTRSSAATRSATGAARPARRARPTPRRSSTSTSPQAAFGTTATVEVRLPVACARCEGSGCEPGTHPARCDVCGGTGEVREVRRSILGQIVTAAPCVACSATGSRIPTPCHECRGDGRVRSSRSIDVEVPAGVDDGQRLRLSGRGPAAPRGGVPGDLYVTVRVAADPRFERHGDDLVHVRTHRVHAGGAGHAARHRHARRPRGADRAAGHAARSRVPAQGPRCSGAARSRAGRPARARRRRGARPTRRPRRTKLLRSLAALRGEEVAAPAEKGVFSRLKSAFQ